MERKISIITVTKNNKEGLYKTIRSVINQKCNDYELIIIDGLSTDGSLEVIGDFKEYITYFISESDEGIYDAMNKGLIHAKNEFVLFLNAGDVFYNDTVLEHFFLIPNLNEYACFYSDTVFNTAKKELISASKKPCRIVHQSFIYRRSLHKFYGMYLNAKDITISDYLFFNLLQNEKWLKLPFIISLCDATGISQNNKHYYQKLGVDLLFNNFSHFSIACMLFAYPLYKKIRHIQYKIHFRISSI